MKEQKQINEQKDLRTVKASIINTINENYWEITEKKEAKPRRPQLLVWLSGEPIPETDYQFGKARNFTSGRSGQIRLAQFLNRLNDCKSLEVMMLYTALYARNLTGISFNLSKALTLAVVNAVNALPELTRATLPEKARQAVDWATGTLDRRQQGEDQTARVILSIPLGAGAGF